MLTNLRSSLLGFAFAILIFTMASIPWTTNAQESADQVRVHDLEKSVTTIQEKTIPPIQDTVRDHESRLIKLEDYMKQEASDWGELKWWLRGIGAAIGAAILERVLRTSGVKLTKSDGMGPVG